MNGQDSVLVNFSLCTIAVLADFCLKTIELNLLHLLLFVWHNCEKTYESFIIEPINTILSIFTIFDRNFHHIKSVDFLENGKISLTITKLVMLPVNYGNVE